MANPLVAPNITSIVSEFGQPIQTAGYLLSVIPLSGIFLTPLIGFAADRIGRRLIIVSCLLLFGIAGLASALASTYSLLLLSRFVQGIGSAGLLNLAIVLIADHWQGQDRTALMGRNAAALAIGLVAIPPLSGCFAEILSWRYSLALASFTIPLAFIAARTLTSGKRAQERSLILHLKEMCVAFRRPVVPATLFSGFILFATIFGVFLTILPIHLNKVYGLDAGATGVVLAAPAVGSIIAALLLGKLSAYLSRRMIIVLSGLLISFSILIMSNASALWLVLVAAAIYGLGDGVSIPSFQDMAATSAPSSHRASVLALWTSSVRLGQLIGPLTAGAILVLTSTSVVMIIGAVVFALVSLFWAWIPFDLSHRDDD